MPAYYNENDPFVAQWLRNLIAEGLIMDGEVDDRSIEDVEPADLGGFQRCHFFAGIAGWELALALAGWPTNAPVWTGSCPCQPFSSAGKREGFDDERHLWPVWLELIRECRPTALFGEQTESADGWTWLNTVRLDLEAEEYAVGAACLPASSVGAPHGRHRLWFVAYAQSIGRPRRLRKPTIECSTDSRRPPESRRNGPDGSRLAYAQGKRCDQRPGERSDPKIDRARERLYSSRRGEADGLADAAGKRRGERSQCNGEPVAGVAALESEPHADGCGDLCGMGDAGSGLGDALRAGSQVIAAPRPAEGGAARRAGQTSGFWGDVDWLPCSDGKIRPVEAGTFPLAARLPGDVGKLRAYGNSIVPQVAAAFIRAASPFSS